MYKCVIEYFFLNISFLNCSARCLSQCYVRVHMWIATGKHKYKCNSLKFLFYFWFYYFSYKVSPCSCAYSNDKHMLLHFSVSVFFFTKTLYKPCKRQWLRNSNLSQRLTTFSDLIRPHLIILEQILLRRRCFSTRALLEASVIRTCVYWK